MAKKVTLSDGSIRWEAYVRSGGRGSRETRRRFSTKTEAEHFETNHNAEKIKLSKIESGLEEFPETTFREEADFWLKTRGQEISPGYLRRFKGILVQVLPICGDMPPLRLHLGRLTGIRAELRSRKQVKASTVNRMMVSIG